MGSSQRSIIFFAVIVTGIVFTGFLLFSFFVYYQFHKNSLEMQTQNHEKLSRIIEQSLNSYFLRVRYITDYAANDTAFKPDKITQLEDALRFNTITCAEALSLKQSLNITKILDSTCTDTDKNTSNIPVKNSELFKGLPEFDSGGNLIASRRRTLARHALRVFPDLHYVFELDEKGNMIFLEPFETQKNIDSFNYSFRDYWQAVTYKDNDTENKRTVLSEAYVSRDPERTQIITVASPIFDENGKIARIFSASISNTTLREQVFKPLREDIALQDETVFYLVDRHGHIVTSSSGLNNYQPLENKKSDDEDTGNFRSYGILNDLVWNTDHFEKGNDVLERETKSWNTNPKFLKRFYSKEYVNSKDVDVLGTFYPISILTVDEEIGTSTKWGILIETPLETINKGTNELRLIFIISITLLLITLLFMVWLLQRHYKKLTYQFETRQKLLELESRKVAHDIRSPLLALQTLVSTMTNPSRHLQNMLSTALNRLNDIANDLSSGAIQQGKFYALQGDSETKPVIESISSLITAIISQKRLEYRNQIGLNIDFQMNTEAYGLFCKVIRTGFERVISNIINNSIEAIEGDGNILITLLRDGNWAKINITDNGKGIPSHILPKLFKRGATFDKPNGKGIGLYLAKKTIESFRGTIHAFSADEETTIRLSIPLEKTPDWFCSHIVLSYGLEVIIMDDDPSIHDVWKERLMSFANYNLTTIDLKSPDELISFTSSKAASNQLYLIDYEFCGSDYNGLTLIENSNITAQSILVTSHDEELHIRQQAIKLGIKILPKSVAAFVPIVWEPVTSVALENK